MGNVVGYITWYKESPERDEELRNHILWLRGQHGLADCPPWFRESPIDDDTVSVDTEISGGWLLFGINRARRQIQTFLDEASNYLTQEAVEHETDVVHLRM